MVDVGVIIKMQCLVTMSAMSWLYAELTVWRVGRVTSWLWRVDFLTSWPCDELVMWQVDWQPFMDRLT